VRKIRLHAGSGSGPSQSPIGPMFRRVRAVGGVASGSSSILSRYVQGLGESRRGQFATSLG